MTQHLPFVSITLILILLRTPALAQSSQVYTPFERGSFDGDVRTGVWEYYDTPTKLGLSVDYTARKTLYIAPDTTPFVIFRDGRWGHEKLLTPTRLHGSYIALWDHYVSSLFASYELRSELFKVYLTFQVNEDGTVSDPEIVGPASPKVRAALLNAFINAPNYWLPGVSYDQRFVRCRMGMKFEFTTDEAASDYKRDTTGLNLRCKLLPGYTHIFLPANSLAKKSKTQRAEIFTPLQFSPDGRRILVDLKLFPEPSIIDLETKKITMLPFENTDGATWLDDDKILFTYKHRYYPTRAALFNISSHEVTHRSDSITFLHSVVPDNYKIAFSTLSRDVTKLYQYDWKEKALTLLETTIDQEYGPVAWSGDGRKLLVTGGDHAFDNYWMLDVNTGLKHQIPLLGVSYIGWSEDDSELYFYRLLPGDYDFFGEVLKYDVTTRQIQTVVPKTRWLMAAKYSHGLLMVREKYEAFLINPQTLAKQKMLMEDVHHFAWSRDGKYIVYTTTKNTIMLYNVETKRNQFVFNGTLRAKAGK